MATMLEQIDFQVVDDDHFWLIKYIDQFDEALLNTRTANVRVMFQRLPIAKIRELERMSPSEQQTLLGQKEPEFKFGMIMPGALPTIRVSDVIFKGRKVGRLRSRLHEFSLSPGELDSFEVLAGQKIEPPPGWPDIPHKILNLSEYSGVKDHPEAGVDFSRSRLAVFKRTNKQGGTDTYVVPRMTIFKAFYAPHKVMANAFCSGPWSRNAHSVVSPNRTRGGLITGVSDGGKQWDVVLQTLVHDDFAPLAAVLYFDEYARQCAEKIYTKQLEDTRAKRRSAWYASAQIPFQAKVDKLTMSFMCVELRSRTARDADGVWREHRKFLVVDICGVSWPGHYPVIGLARTNDNESVDEPIVVDQPPPFSGAPETRPANEETVLQSDVEAHAGKSTTTIDGNQWSWLGNGPQIKVLEKESSYRYKGGKPLANHDGSAVSAGAHTYEGDALPKADVKTLVRIPNARFEHMHKAFVRFVDSGLIRDLAVVHARRPGQAVGRSSFDCWSFIDDESLRRGTGPTSGFRVFYDKPTAPRNKYWRSALVLRFMHEGSMRHWIEIECRKSDFRSVYLTIDPALYSEGVIETALNEIALARGRNLKDKLPASFNGEPIAIATFRHPYRTDGSLNEDLLAKFLRDNV